MTKVALATFAMASGLFVASCGDERSELVVKVETDGPTPGFTTEREVRVEINPEQAAAIREDLLAGRADQASPTPPQTPSPQTDDGLAARP